MGDIVSEEVKKNKNSNIGYDHEVYPTHNSSQNAQTANEDVGS